MNETYYYPEHYPRLKHSKGMLVCFDESENEIQQTQSRDCISPLEQLGILRVHGADAKTFLQGQLTCDLNDLEKQNAILGAYCDRKGKMLCNFHLTQSNQQYYLCLDKSLVDTTINTLKKYALFSKVTFENATNLVLIGTIDHSTSLQQCDNTIAAIDIPGEPKRKIRIIEKQNAASTWQELLSDHQPIGQNAWTYCDIQTGIGYACAATSLKFLPQMFNWDQLGAISFNKGCYLGQEIIARAHHRGNVKRRLLSTITDPTEIQRGDKTDTEQGNGTVIAHCLYQGKLHLLIIP